MITDCKIFFPILVLLLALASIPAVSEASSHSLAALAGSTSETHAHHDPSNHKSDAHAHHDPSNHSHELADYPVMRHAFDFMLLAHKLTSLASDSPRSFRYRIDRPPK